MAYPLFGSPPDGPVSPDVTEQGQAAPELDTGEGHHSEEPLLEQVSEEPGAPTTARGATEPIKGRLSGDWADDDGVHIDQLLTAHPNSPPAPYGTGPVDRRAAPFGIQTGSPTLIHDQVVTEPVGDPGPVVFPEINRMLVRTLTVGGDPAQVEVRPALLFPPDPDRIELHLRAKAEDPLWRLAGDKGELLMCGHAIPSGEWLPPIRGYTGPVWVDRDSAILSTTTTVTITGIAITNIPAHHGGKHE